MSGDGWRRGSVDFAIILSKLSECLAPSSILARANDLAGRTADGLNERVGPETEWRVIGEIVGIQTFQRDGLRGNETPYRGCFTFMSGAGPTARDI